MDDDLDQLLMTCEDSFEGWSGEKPCPSGGGAVVPVDPDIAQTIGFTLPGEEEAAQRLKEPDLPATPPTEPEDDAGDERKEESCVAGPAGLQPPSPPSPAKVSPESHSVTKQKPSFGTRQAESSTKSKVAPKFGPAKRAPALASRAKPKEGTDADSAVPSTRRSENAVCSQEKNEETSATAATSHIEVESNSDDNISVPSSPCKQTPSFCDNKTSKPSFTTKPRPAQKTAHTSDSTTTRPKGKIIPKTKSKDTPETQQPKKAGDGGKSKQEKALEKTQKAEAKQKAKEEKAKLKEEKAKQKEEKEREKEEKARRKEEKELLKSEKRNSAEEKKLQEETERQAPKKKKLSDEKRKVRRPDSEVTKVDPQSGPECPQETSPCEAACVEADDQLFDDAASLRTVILNLQEADGSLSDAELPELDLELDMVCENAEEGSGIVSAGHDGNDTLRSIAQSLQEYDFDDIPNSTARIKHSTKEQKRKKDRKRQRVHSKEEEKEEDRLVKSMTGLENNGDIWVECYACHKWRRLAGRADASEVEDKWQCSMNADEKTNTCSAAEEDWRSIDPSYTFTPCSITLGSVVWARVNGFPWWPGLVDVDPEHNAFANFESGDGEEYAVDAVFEPLAFHVVFGFDNLPTRAWIDRQSVRLFKRGDRATDFGPVKSTCKKQIKQAMSIAKDCLPCSIDDRIEHFGHVTSMMSRSRKRPSAEQTSFDGSEPTATPPGKKSCTSASKPGLSAECSSANGKESKDCLPPDFGDLCNELESPSSPEY